MSLDGPQFNTFTHVQGTQIKNVKTRNLQVILINICMDVLKDISRILFVYQLL